MPKGTCSVETCDRPAPVRGKRGLCHAHYMRWFYTGDVAADVPIQKRNRPVDERFWEKVDKAGPLPAWAPFLGPCWLWTGVPTWKGYGQLRVNGRKLAAHRLSYTLNVGPIPEGLHIDHLCRVRHCVNPSHLEAVTPEENWRRGFAPSAVAARAS